MKFDLTSLIIPPWVKWAALAVAVAIVLRGAYVVGYDRADALCEKDKSAVKDVVIEKGKDAANVREKNRALPDGAAVIRLREKWQRD